MATKAPLSVESQALLGGDLDQFGVPVVIKLLRAVVSKMFSPLSIESFVAMIGDVEADWGDNPGPPPPVGPNRYPSRLLPAGFQVEGGQEIWDLCEEFAANYGIPLGLLVGLVAHESRGNPDPPSGPAYGLLQLERGTGQGGSHPVSDLLDPRKNLEIGVPNIAAAWWAFATDLWLVLQHAGHPAVLENMPLRDQERIIPQWLTNTRQDYGGVSPVRFIARTIKMIDGIDVVLPIGAK